jgi:hypothetical protein
MLCSLARDPLLRFTAEPVLSLGIAEELSRKRITDTMRNLLRDRLNDSILDKVIRNAASSWTQSGHLQGRVRKHRHLAKATPYSTAYALFLGYLQGIRGSHLFDTGWTKVLDIQSSALRSLAAEAKRLGCLDLKMAGDVVEIGFNSIMTTQRTREAHVKN